MALPARIGLVRNKLPRRWIRRDIERGRRDGRNFRLRRSESRSGSGEDDDPLRRSRRRDDLRCRRDMRPLVMRSAAVQSYRRVLRRLVRSVRSRRGNVHRIARHDTVARIFSRLSLRVGGVFQLPFPGIGQRHFAQPIDYDGGFILHE